MEGQNNRRVVVRGLPEEMIEEILSRLPVKSLLRFRCVSKAWRSLIGSKLFIKKQLNNSKRNTTLAHQRVVLCRRRELFGCDMLSLFRKSKPDIHALEFNIVSIDSLRLVGSCNGLVCILLNSKEFVLWNPCTRISKKLPDIIIDEDQKLWSYGFGFDEWSGDYKVVAIFRKRDFYSAHAYSLKSDSWKKLMRPCYYCMYLDRRGKLQSGKVIWDLWVVGKKYRVGLEFDLKREVFEMTFVVDESKKTLTVRVETYPSLAKCMNSPTSPTSVLMYEFAMYIESLETLDIIF